MRTDGPVRRAQLIAPFGVGSTFVLPDGVSVITCGLDHWFRREAGSLDDLELDVSEFELREWRLERRLEVSHFRLPPDFRRRHRRSDGINEDLTIPVLRFPQWHVCPACSHLEKMPLNRVEDVFCRVCQAEKERRIAMAQVRFVCMCSDGHLQDFPWLEWVHKDPSPTCSGPLRLVSTGSLSVAGQRVECKGCNADARSLSGSVYSDRGGGTTNLTEQLYPGGRFLCGGFAPWLGEHREACDEALHVALRAASNVYFSQVRSAIYLPRELVPEELTKILNGVTARTVLGTIKDMGGTPTVELMRNQLKERLGMFSDEEISLALLETAGEGHPDPPSHAPGSPDDEEGFRREELAALIVERESDQLFVRRVSPDGLGEELAPLFESLMLVERLKETRVLTGFSRFSPTSTRTAQQLQAQLWRTQPDRGERWLPAYEVYGEGILISLNEERVRSWEGTDPVQDWVARLNNRRQVVDQVRDVPHVPVLPRFLLLHTLAHLIMDRLTFRSGYSSASLRERLYVSDKERDPMCSVLIYTAAGDSDGTLGGLVRMGEPSNLRPVVEDALARASWCSADPVCFEIGRTAGQGPDSCNLAGCHNCVLLPETACENANRFLDRMVVVGHPEMAELGFFSG